MADSLGFVESIHIYPIKSCAGIQLDSIDVDDMGPKFDRRWMIVQPDGTFVTQRQIPSMVRIRPRLERDAMILRCEGMSDLTIPIADCKRGETLNAHVWKDEIEARDCGDPSAAWLSEILAKEVRLAYMHEDAPRIRDKSGEFKMGFADSRPFLLTNLASLEDLNKRIGSDVPMDRFRPNLVVRSSEPYSEDEWPNVRIGSVDFRHSIACDRCIIPTLDQTTGKRQGKEPLKTLGTYRAPDGVVIFGRRMVHARGGKISVGDIVTSIP